MSFTRLLPVTSCTDVWIETYSTQTSAEMTIIVTSCTDVWIETVIRCCHIWGPTQSHPVRMCGLKHSDSDQLWTPHL